MYQIAIANIVANSSGGSEFLSRNQLMIHDAVIAVNLIFSGKILQMAVAICIFKFLVQNETKRI